MSRASGASASESPVEFQRDDNADLAKAVGHRVMNILSDDAMRNMHDRGAPQRHVFADRRDQVGDGLANRPAARIMGALDRLDVGQPLLDGDQRDGARQRLKLLVAGDEIGLGIDLDDDAVMAMHGDGDEALGGDAARFLGGLGETLLAQPVDRRLDIALGLGEGVLAIHHAGAGLLAKILHQCGRDARHCRLPSVLDQQFAPEAASLDQQIWTRPR